MSNPTKQSLNKPSMLNKSNKSNKSNKRKILTPITNFNKKRFKKSKEPKLPYNLREIYVPEISCPDCKKYGNIIEDIRGGKTVCTVCGLIIENQVLSYIPPRSFANDDKCGKSDPKRCGMAVNTYLSDICGLSTDIGTCGKNSSLSLTQKKIMGESSHDRKYKKGILDIQKYGERLNLTKDVKNFSSELFKELMTRSELNQKRGINIITACVYIACKKCNCNRCLDGLCDQFIVDKKVIKKILTIIHKLKASNKIKIPIIKKGKGYIAATTGEILAIKFGFELGLNKDTMKWLRIISRKIASLHILDGKKPNTFASVAIYLTCIVNPNENQRRCFKEISIITKVSEHTIKKVFREYLYGKMLVLLPSQYGDAKQVSNILWNKDNVKAYQHSK